jgi:hypothetical protein
LSFLKIDAEGSEPLVLAGARRVLERFHPIVHIEVNKDSLRASQRSADDIEKPLRSLGYQLFCIRSVRTGIAATPTLRPVESLERDLDELQDVLALHPTHHNADDIARLL